MEKTEQQIREAGKDYAAGIRSSNHSITADQAVAIANHHFNGYTQALADMKEERKEVDLTELKKKWDTRSDYIREEKYINTEVIWEFFLPHLQQPAPDSWEKYAAAFALWKENKAWEHDYSQQHSHSITDQIELFKQSQEFKEVNT